MTIIPFTKKRVKAYLDQCIDFWWSERDKASNEAGYIRVLCYIDAFQSIRMGLFGETLEEEKEDG